MVLIYYIIAGFSYQIKFSKISSKTFYRPYIFEQLCIRKQQIIFNCIPSVLLFTEREKEV